MTPTPWIQSTWGELAVPEVRINFIVCFLILFCVENCARQSDFFENRKQRGFFNLIKWHLTKQALWMKPLRGCWIEDVCTKPPVIRWRHKIKFIFLFLWTLSRMWSNWSHGNFWGVRGLEILTQNLYRGGF